MASRAVPDLDVEASHDGMHRREVFLVLRCPATHLDRAAAVRTPVRSRRRSRSSSTREGRRPYAWRPQAAPWNDAQAYVSWLSRTAGARYRLPTEAEWERAAAGSRPGCYEERTRREGTCPVGSYAPTPRGCTTWLGIWIEWTDDCSGDDCRYGRLRGGAWIHDVEDLHSGKRIGFLPRAAYRVFGFRVSRTLE